MKISSISLIFLVLFSCQLLSHGDGREETENTNRSVNNLVKRPLPDAETVEAKRRRFCEPEPEEREEIKPTEDQRLLGKKREGHSATPKKAKQAKTYDELADLGFDLSEVLEQLARPQEVNEMSAVFGDPHKNSSLLVKRDRYKNIPRPKAKKRKTPKNHFDLSAQNLFYLNQETKIFELDEAVLAEIKNSLSIMPLTAINFEQETNNATVLWWLVFACYSSHKELIGIIDGVLAALHEKINLDYAPRGKLNYLSIKIMLQFARTSFRPTPSDIQFTLRTLMNPMNKFRDIPEDMEQQENLLNAGFLEIFNSLNM